VQHGGETESAGRPSFFSNRNTGALNRPGPFARTQIATEDPEETRESPSVRANGRETLEAPVINLREESGSLRRAREETIVTRVRPQPTRPTEGSPVFEPTMMLCLEIGEARTPLVMRLPQRRPLVFGRDDPASGERPDIDLIPYGGFQRGISRRHSALELSGKLLSIKDLKSSNGTLLNGVRLDPHERYQLRDGDVLQMGQMTLRISFKQ
jgi:hypothetical protein